jgi:ABC-type dipeptide/oligopeptide/nickel transport system permease component
MLRYLVGRLIAMVPIVLGATLIVFFVGRLAPGDPVQILFGDIRDPAAEARARAQLGLDRPVPEQYLRFLVNLGRFDLGVSYAYPGRRVSRMVLEALPATLQLGVIAVAAALAIGLPLGILAAVRRQGPIDRVVRLITLLGVSVPFFVIAVALILLLSLRLRLLPVAGWGTPQHLVLPVVVLMLRPMAYITRITRLAMLQVMGEDYIRTAHAKGLPPRAVDLRHALRNAGITIATTVGLALGVAVTGAFVTETIFGVPGMGRATVTAIFQRDYPVIQAVVLLYTGLFLMLNLALDLAYAALDPRIRYV